MKILYLSVHEILEYDELRMLTDLGHEVYSHGAYMMPGGAEGRKRPPLPQLPYDEQMIELMIRYGKTNLHEEMLARVDAVIVMHEPSFITANWAVLSPFIQRGGRVIWRSIGQSQPSVERTLAPYRDEGLQLVRYSPTENTIVDYIGSDALIRFGKYPEDFLPYEGTDPVVVSFTQSMRKRWDHCGWATYQEVTRGLNRRLYGPGNEDSGVEGGLLDYEVMLSVLMDARALFYTGTYPAAYTLSFVEAWMAGTPIVAVGPGLGNGRNLYPGQSTYEVHQLINDGVDGFVSDDLDTLKERTMTLMTDPELAKDISCQGRQRATELFGAENIMEQWERFLGHH